MINANHRDPIVGETLYSLNVGNAARRQPQVLTPVTVTKVGRKYFEADGTAYHLGSWREKSDYAPNTALYETEQEWLDERESAILTSAIRKAFDHYGKPTFDLSALREISAILDRASGESAVEKGEAAS